MSTFLTWVAFIAFSILALYFIFPVLYDFFFFKRNQLRVYCMTKTTKASMRKMRRRHR